jgi:hypothetical protein
VLDRRAAPSHLRCIMVSRTLRAILHYFFDVLRLVKSPQRSLFSSRHETHLTLIQSERSLRAKPTL